PPVFKNGPPKVGRFLFPFVYCIVTLYSLKCSMIKSFRHKGLEQFHKTDSKSGIQPHHATKLKIQLTALNVAESPEDLKAPASWRLHQLTGDLAGFWSLTVNGNWRVIFRFDEKDIELV